MGSAPYRNENPPRQRKSTGNNRNRQKSRRAGSARRRLSKKERLRRKRIRLLKRFAGAFLVLLVLLLLIVHFAGKSSSDSATAESGGQSSSSSEAVFSKNGSIKVTSVESFDKSYYSEDELSAMIESQIKEANDAGCRIKNEGLHVKNGVAALTLSYGSSSDYETFNERKLYYGKFSDAEASGYDPKAAIGCASMENSEKLLTADDLSSLTGKTFVYVTDEMALTVPYDILYASANVRVSGKKAEPTSEVSENAPAMLVLVK